MIDILIPTLGRAGILGSLVDNIEAVTPPGEYQLIFVLDKTDVESRRALIDRNVVVVGHDGTYPVKIAAGYQRGEGDLVAPVADDVAFHSGWLEACLNALRDPRVQVLGTDDLSPSTANRDHATMPILRRSYCEEPGAAWGESDSLFHTGYMHNWVETETWQLALHRGVAGWAEDCVIEHLHPAWGKREVDDTDRKGNLRGWDADEALFRRRRSKWLQSP